MTFEEAEKWKFNPFDLTKVWPHGEFPLIPVGRLTFDRNPKNYFAEVMTTFVWYLWIISLSMRDSMTVIWYFLFVSFLW